MSLRSAHFNSKTVTLLAALAFVFCEFVHVRFHLLGELSTQIVSSEAGSSYELPDTEIGHQGSADESCPLCHGAFQELTPPEGPLFSNHLPPCLILPGESTPVFRYESNRPLRGPPAFRS